ncbi:hypothetical protein GCM10025795_12200 [Verticiella sediminum]
MGANPGSVGRWVKKKDRVAKPDIPGSVCRRANGKARGAASRPRERAAHCIIGRRSCGRPAARAMRRAAWAQAPAAGAANATPAEL